MKTYKIHLVRHGLTQANIDGRYAGHTDIPVSEQGISQLSKMTEDFEYPSPDAVFSSPLTRCLQTSEIVFKDKKPIIINELIEYNFGVFEGLTSEDLVENEDFKAWLSGDRTAAPPFGESNQEFGMRVGKAFIKIVDGLLKTGTTNSAIVAHGGVIMFILSWFGLPERKMTDWLVPNGCGYTICINPSLWSKTKKFEIMEELPLLRDNGQNSIEKMDEIKLGIKNSKYKFFV
jgi:alpha-ribazole phosphatase